MTNGEHEEARRRRASDAAKKAAESRKRVAPMRKVVKREVVDSTLIEELECGHIHRGTAALFGGAPKSRRCLKCLDELEEAVEKGEG